MATSNPITGDTLVSRANTEKYESNYDRIFGKKSKDKKDGKAADHFRETKKKVKE